MEDFTDEGNLEAYCLGTLPDDLTKELTEKAAADPLLQAEIDRTLAALEGIAIGPAPVPGLKNRVLDFFEKHRLPEPIDLKNPPDIHRLSDAFAWEKAVEGLGPKLDFPGYKVRPLFESGEKELCLVWLDGEMVEAAHEADDFLESFLLLEGSCACDFDGVKASFSAGDYFDIPPGTRHRIANSSVGLPCVKGLVQRRKAA